MAEGKNQSDKGNSFHIKLPKAFAEKAVQCHLTREEDIVRVTELLSKDLWAYRGQAKARWGLTTTLERNVGLKGITPKSERRAINEFRELTRLYFPQCSSLLSSLAAMQHYGAPTRLLDFSRSLMIALFFAFEDEKDAKKVKERKYEDKHAIWAINIGDALWHSKLMQFAIEEEVKQAAAKSTCKNYETENDPFDHVREGSFNELMSDWIARFDKTNEIAERLLEGTIPAPHSGILPVDIPGDNPRMAAQNGMFIMSGDFRPFEDNLKEAFGLYTNLSKLAKVSVNELERSLKNTGDLKIIKFVLGEKMRPFVLALLEAANISNARLFPDLAGIASSIRYT